MNKLACQYVVVKYVPDLVRNESRNIGIILRCKEVGYINCRFLSNLHYKLGNAATPLDIQIIKAYIQEFSNDYKQFAAFPSTKTIFPEEFLAESYFNRLADRGLGKIQFSTPQGCLSDNPENEISYLFKVYVGEEISQPEHLPKRSRLKTEVRKEFKNRGFLEDGEKSRIRGFRVDAEIGGGRSKVKHLVDFALENGGLYLIETIDMRVKNEKIWQLDALNAAVKFDDLKHGRQNDIKPYSVVATPGPDGGNDYLKILGTYSEIFKFTDEKDKFQLFKKVGHLIKPISDLFSV